MRVWVVRAGDRNALVDEFVQRSFIALSYPEVGNVRSLDRWDIERRLEDSGRSNVDLHADTLLAFVHEVVTGDAVVLPDPGRGEVVIGVIVGAYEHRPDLPDDRVQHQRRVEWLGRHSTKDLPESFRDVTRQRPALRRRDSASFEQHLAAVRSGTIGRPADRFDKPRAPRPTTGAPRVRRTAATARAAAAPPKPTTRLCPSCFQQKPIALFAGEICRDCE